MQSEPLVLALETSGPLGSVALLRGSAVLGEESLGEGAAHGVALHPAMQRLLRAAGIGAADLGLVVVGTGPGSFTGMRVGVGAARTLAFAAGCPVIGIPSFDAWAAGAPPGAPGVACARDARRGEAWFALYGPARGDGSRAVVTPPCRKEAAAAAATLPPGCLVFGDMPGPLAGDPSPPRASILARLGLAAFLRDGAPDPATVLPLYLQEPLAVKKGEGVRRG